MSGASHTPGTPSLDAPEPPTLADIGRAAGSLADRAVFTPLVESPLLNDRLGCRVLAKAEVLQWGLRAIRHSSADLARMQFGIFGGPVGRIHHIVHCARIWGCTGASLAYD